MCSRRRDRIRNHDLFATIIVPGGCTATVYAMPPMGGSAGHSHGVEQMPNEIDPAGGWTNTGESYSVGSSMCTHYIIHLPSTFSLFLQEPNGIPRDVWTKQVTGSYHLFHTTSHGWCVLYLPTCHQPIIF